jgi:hypothetical protein
VKYREIVRLIEADGCQYPSSGRATEVEQMSEYGLGVVGDSREEVEQLIREAIAFHLDGLRQAGDPIPQPSAVAMTLVEVPAA